MPRPRYSKEVEVDHSVAKFLVKGLDLSLPKSLERYIHSDLDTTCAITGTHITEGIPWKRVIPASTGEYLDLMHGMAFPYLSLDAAAAYKGSWNLGSRMIFEDGTAYHPYISTTSAGKSDRTFWSALVRHVWPARREQLCMVIMAGDFKKRVWPRSVVGPLGANTPVYVLDSDRFVSQLLSIDWERMIHILDLVEEVYALGFSKDAISNGLYTNYATFVDRPIESIKLETKLQQVRRLPEFTAAILIAQKGARK